MTFLEVFLATLLVISVVVSVLSFYLALLYHRKWQMRQTKAFEMGGRQVRGDLYQLLGTFASLEDYEQLILLSTTSKQASLDLLGVKEDELDFIEFKKKGSPLQTQERKIKRLVEESKVKYVIKDVDLPEQFEMREREAAMADNRDSP